MIHVRTNQQVWDGMYERKISAANIFEVQDEIVKLIISELGDSWNLISGKSQGISLIAVA